MPPIPTFSWFNDVQPILEKKFGDIRDFGLYKKGLTRVRYGTSHYSVQHETEWKERNYPQLLVYQKDPIPNYAFNQAGMDYYNSIEGKKWFNEIEDAYDKAKDGRKAANKLYPNYDFWNEILVDTLDINNGCVRWVTWTEIKAGLSKKNAWAGEIIDYLLLHFPDEMKIEVSW